MRIDSNADHTELMFRSPSHTAVVEFDDFVTDDFVQPGIGVAIAFFDSCLNAVVAKSTHVAAAFANDRVEQ